MGNLTVGVLGYIISWHVVPWLAGPDLRLHREIASIVLWTGFISTVLLMIGAGGIGWIITTWLMQKITSWRHTRSARTAR